MRDAPRYRIWPPVALGAPLVLGSLASRVAPEHVPIPDPWRNLLAVALILLFAGINVPTYAMLAGARTGILPGQPSAGILARGAFAFTRNPLYVGLLALYAGLALWGDWVWALVLLPVAFAALHWGAVLPEERYLEAKFGEEYLSYKRRVRRWL